MTPYGLTLWRVWKKEQTIRDRQPGPGSVTREFRVRLSNSNGVRVFALFYKPLLWRRPYPDRARCGGTLRRLTRKSS